LLGSLGGEVRSVRMSRALAQAHGSPVLHCRQSSAAVHRTLQHHHVLLRQRVEGAQPPRQDQDRQQQW